MSKHHAFYSLDPEKVLQAAEAAGFAPTGEFTQLNSYENRVFDLVLEKPYGDLPSTQRLIAKFYRPGRWSLEALREEHQFLYDLREEGISAVAPLILPKKTSLLEFGGMYVAFFPKVLGRSPQEFLGDQLKQVGRLLARLHNVGVKRDAPNRPVLDTDYYGGWPTLERLMETWVAPEMAPRYEKAAVAILNYLDEHLPLEDYFRIHGDCHKGNLLHNDHEFFFVDFDDCCIGPAVHDFWMLLSGDPETADYEKNEILSGYEELRDFPEEQWALIPALRGLRILSYAGWIAARWEDPSFPRLFPNFNTYSYWAEETEALERIAWSL